MARRAIGTVGWLLRGAAAGAAGTTALNAVTYLDMVLRGRPASSTPQRTVEEAFARTGASFPGNPAKRPDRVEALGALTGIAAGVGVGALTGLARALGPRISPLAGTGVVTAGVLLATNGPMTVLGVTDPRTWSGTDWIADVVPHLAYSAVVVTTLDALG